MRARAASYDDRKMPYRWAVANDPRVAPCGAMGAALPAP
jgi:hypothetical protein